MNEYYDNLPEVVKVKVDKYNKLVSEGKDPFKQVKFDRTAYTADILADFDAFDGKDVAIAGRIMAKRGQGKVAFFDLQDAKGRVQLFNKKDVLGDDYENVLNYDIGDIVGVKGEVFKTQRGEVSVRVSEMTLLSKSIQVLPEKFHGLKDPELRYRQRYVDLIMNPEVKETFVKRA